MSFQRLAEIVNISNSKNCMNLLTESLLLMGSISQKAVMAILLLFFAGNNIVHIFIEFPLVIRSCDCCYSLDCGCILN